MLIRALFVFIVGLSCSAVQAVPVQGLYHADVVVADQSEASQKKALRQGLLDVLIKVTGRSNIANNAEVSGALNKAKSYLSEFSFDSVDGTKFVPEHILMSINYAEGSVDRLIRKATLPIWPLDRPEFLVWLVTDVPGRGPRYVNSELMPEARVIVERAAKRRAMPLSPPLLDLEDRLVLPASSAWAFNESSMRDAAERYAARHWAVIRFANTPSGDWRGAVYVNSASRHDFRTLQADTLENLLNKSMQLSVDYVAAELGFVQEAGDEKLSLSLEGIDSYRQYKQALNYFDNLKMVANVQVTAVNGDRLQLLFDLNGPDQQFLKTLRRGKHVVEIADLNSAILALRFEWKK